MSSFPVAFGADAGVRPASVEPDPTESPRTEPPPREARDRVVDAGVLPGGVADPKVAARPLEAMSDDELRALSGRLERDPSPIAQARLEQVADELDDRLLRTLSPRRPSPARPANTLVTPQVGLAILENMAEGRPPFRPELGKGEASWFVVEGDPYVGKLAGKSVPVRAEVVPPEAGLVLHDAELNRMLEAKVAETRAEVEASWRRHHGIDPNKPLAKAQRNSFDHFHRRLAQSRMWDDVGRSARASPNGVVEIVLEPGSQFSKSGPGRFIAMARPQSIRIKGGVPALVDAIEASGARTSPELRAAAEAYVSKMRMAGQVRAAFHYGGRVLLVVGVAADAYEIATAQDKRKAIYTSAGGWAGATAASTTFAAWFAPADVAGPWAWAGHGVGVLVAGGVGYYLGSESVRYTYELSEAP